MKLPSIIICFLIAALLVGCSNTPIETSESIDLIETAIPIEEIATPQDPASAQSSAQLEETSDHETEDQIPPQEFANPWQSLSFDQFLEESCYSVMQRDPELLTKLGLSQVDT
jgi:hypothetical protein